MKGQNFSMILIFMVIDLYISNTAFYMCSLQDSFFISPVTQQDAQFFTKGCVVDCRINEGHAPLS